MIKVTAALPPNHGKGKAFAQLTLPSDQRRLRRKVLTVKGEEEVLVDFPEPLTLAASVPPAVLPANEMSALVSPVTGSLNTTVNWMAGRPVGSTCAGAWLIVTVGATLSNATALSALVDACDGFPSASVAAPAGIVATTFPLPLMPVIETV